MENGTVREEDSQVGGGDWSVDLSEVASVLTVRHLVTPIEHLTGFALGDDAGDAAGVMSAAGFDAAPVWHEENPVGRVWRDRLLEGGIVGDHFEPISASYVISASAPISHALHWLAADRWLFVVEGRGFVGIVTPSDLNRQAVRTYFYLLLGELEMRLGEAVRRHVAETDAVLSLLKGKRRELASSRLEELRRGDIDSDIVSALDLTDLVQIGRGTERIRDMFGVDSVSEWDQLTKPIPAFRNNIMHMVRPLLGDTAGLDQLIRRDDRLRRLIGVNTGHPG